MLTYLRKIRKSLIDSGSTQKYLLYAIGEIGLVVIGILIALQVNNYNELRKNNHKAKKLCKSLYAEFIDNKTNLNEVFEYHLRVKRACDQLLDMVNNYSDGVSVDSLKIQLAEYGYFMTYDPFNSVLNGAILSGDIHLIENDSLLNLLFSWSTVIADAREEEVQAKQVLFEQINFMSEYVREVEIWKYRNKSVHRSDYNGLLRNPDFENKVHFRRSIVAELVREQRRLSDYIDKVLEFLKDEMD